MLFWWLASALAAPCPDIPEQVAQAWSAFDDAELDDAETHLDTAIGALTCQQTRVATSDLLALYRLAGLVAIARDDRDGALYATIRTVTIDPAAPPSPDLGPALAELHETWSRRLAATEIMLFHEGEGEVWIDGHAITPGEGTAILAGEHLLQAHDAAGWHTAIVDLSEDHTVHVGDGLRLVEQDRPEPPPEAPPAPERRPGPFARPHRVEVLVAGGATAGVGAGLIVAGAVRHGEFARDDYLRPTFGDCAAADPCYATEREDAIRRDALGIQLLYGVGYVLTGLGITAVGLELFVLPTPTRGGGTLGVKGRW